MTPLLPRLSESNPFLLRRRNSPDSFVPGESCGSGVPACDLIVGIGLSLPWKSLLYLISGELVRCVGGEGVMIRSAGRGVGARVLVGESERKALEAMLGVAGWEAEGKR